MLTEKPIAANLVDARRMARAAREAGVALMINWPITWSPAIRTAKRLLDEGVIGEVWEIKWRNGASMGPLTHADPQPSDEEKGAEWWHRAGTGGGALLDYCCYGACLSCWYLGEQALAAWGITANLRSPYAEVEDNAVIGVRFPRALAILEGTWTTWHTGVHSGVIVYGSEGTLVAPWNDDVALFTARAGEPGVPDQVVESDPLPAGRATPAEAFVHHLETGASLHRTLTVEHNLEAMAILDAGRRAAESGCLEAVEGEVQV
jgi:glucose-fructose oxidoreductase